MFRVEGLRLEPNWFRESVASVEKRSYARFLWISKMLILNSAIKIQIECNRMTLVFVWVIIEYSFTIYHSHCISSSNAIYAEYEVKRRAFFLPYCRSSCSIASLLAHSKEARQRASPPSLTGTHHPENANFAKTKGWYSAGSAYLP